MPVSRKGTAHAQPAGQRSADPRKYMRLAKIVREQISEGLLPPGQAVPSITALCAEHQISRGTARQAMLLLEDDGLIYRVPGLGYHVCGPRRGHRSPRDHSRYSKDNTTSRRSERRCENLPVRVRPPGPGEVTADEDVLRYHAVLRLLAAARSNPVEPGRRRAARAGH